MEHRVQAFRLRKTKKGVYFFSFKSITELAGQTGVSNTTPLPARECKAPFRWNPKTKNFQDSPSHRILRYMHVVLNVDEKKLTTQLAEKS